MILLLPKRLSSSAMRAAAKRSAAWLSAHYTNGTALFCVSHDGQFVVGHKQGDRAVAEAMAPTPEQAFAKALSPLIPQFETHPPMSMDDLIGRAREAGYKLDKNTMTTVNNTGCIYLVGSTPERRRHLGGPR